MPRFVKLDDVQREIREEAQKFTQRAANKPAVAVGQPLRVRQIAPATDEGGCPLVSSHPALKVKA